MCLPFLWSNFILIALFFIYIFITHYYPDNVEMEIVLPGDMTVRESHDIALALQHKIESLEDVERAFVHVSSRCSSCRALLGVFFNYNLCRYFVDCHILAWREHSNCDAVFAFSVVH